jgi:2-oxoisovalerate dehydrogenase E2 component (dihydrolipoyl transacylase)
MATVTMPQLGESVTEGTILKWLKQPGDRVALDDSLCEIETEKVTAELPSAFEGTMGTLLVAEGDTVEVGQPLCEILEAGGLAGTPVAATAPAVSATGGWAGGPMAIPPEELTVPTANGAVGAPLPARQPAAAATSTARRPDQRERFYSPAVMRLASEHHLELSAISGTGVGGRVTRKDVEAYIAAAPAPTAPRPAPTAPPGALYDVLSLSPTRRTIAENLKRSNLEAPQAWTMVEADVTGLVRRREAEKEGYARREGVDLTLLPYFTAAVCETLREYPVLNARWENDELRAYRAQNVGIAIATESGLVVPVVHNAGDLSVAGLAKQIADLVQRAHARKLRIEDVEGGTFTVNNTGVFGSIASKPIVNYPQVAIVTMERVVKRPVVVEGDGIAVRSMMNICLSFDHRAMDGLEAGNFLASLRLRLEAIA